MMAILLKSGRMQKEKYVASRLHHCTRERPRRRCEIPHSTAFSHSVMRFAAEERENETSRSNCLARISMPDPNLPLLEEAVHKLAPFLDEIVFVGGITLGLLITDKAAAPIRGTNDVQVC